MREERAPAELLRDDLAPTELLRADRAPIEILKDLFELLSEDLVGLLRDELFREDLVALLSDGRPNELLRELLLPTDAERGVVLLLLAVAELLLLTLSFASLLLRGFCELSRALFRGFCKGLSRVVSCLFRI